MKGQRVGYIRVSTITQNTDRQLADVELDNVFEDKASGRDASRPRLQALLDHVREGDTVYVHSMDRLARNVDDLRRLVREMTSRGVRVDFVKEGLTFTGDEAPTSTLLLTMLGALAEFERALIRERQREGIALAKDRGVCIGRKKKLTDEQVIDLRARAGNGDSKAALAREFGVSRDTVYQYLKAELAQ